MQPTTTISNGRVMAAFDPTTSSCTSLRFADGNEQSVLRRSGPMFDLIVDGKPFWGNTPRQITAVQDDGRSAQFVYEREGVRVTHVVELDADLPLLRQRVQIDVIDGAARKLTAVEYFLPGLAVGDLNDCLLQAPGQIIPPDSSYSELAKLPLDWSYSEPLPWYPHGWLESAPDATAGLVAVENPAQHRIVSAWQHSPVATTFPTIDGDGELLTVAHRHQVAAWLRPGVSVQSDGHCVLLTEGTWQEHLALFNRLAYGDWEIAAAGAPAWFADARLFQIDPHPVSAWQARLDELRDMGFTLLYLMPVWSNQGNEYALLDHYAIDPRVGTVEELQRFVEAAHARGMRVLFDFIPQGIGVLSPFIEKHPEWLVRDEQGRPFASHGWGPKAGEPATEGTWSLDWGRPDYRAWILNWAVWNLETFDIDGWRTDALHWKEPNFGPDNPYPAWQTMFGGVRLARELRDQLRAAKPEAILFSEVGGPIFQQMHEATYENGWLLWRANEGWLKGEPVFSGAQWTRLLADAQAARPAGTPRAVFSANHDLPHIPRLAKDSPLGNTVSFVHAFTAGFPFVTWKEIDGREAFFAALMRERGRLTGYRGYHDRAEPDHDALWTALWSKPGHDAVLAVTNLSHEPAHATITLADPIATAHTRWGTDEIEATVRNGALAVTLPAAGYALIELDPSN